MTEPPNPWIVATPPDPSDPDYVGDDDFNAELKSALLFFGALLTVFALAAFAAVRLGFFAAAIVLSVCSIAGLFATDLLP